LRGPLGYVTVEHSQKPSRLLRTPLTWSIELHNWLAVVCGQFLVAGSGQCLNRLVLSPSLKGHCVALKTVTLVVRAAPISADDLPKKAIRGGMLGLQDV